MKLNIPIRAIVAFSVTAIVTVSVITVGALKSLCGVDLQLAFKLSEIYSLVKNDFYYSCSIGDLSTGAVNGFVDGLGDDYAAYYGVDAAEVNTESLKGKTHGIGVYGVRLKNSEGIFVWKVYDGGTAKAAGIKSGDIITAIDGKKITDQATVNMLFGDNGQKLTVTVKRGEKSIDYVVECAVFDIQSVFYEVVENENIGYIQVTTFNSKTYKQFKKAINALKNENVKSVIIDLRHNGGGTLASTAKMLDYLLPEGNIVNIKYNDGKVYARYKSDKNCVDLPFAVLVDSSSASCSEIFASAMRDLGGAVLIGEQTYGKSVVQRNYALRDGSSVKFTIGEFVPTSGESYNKTGLVPDIAVENEFKTVYEFYYMTKENDKALSAALDYFSKYE